MECFTFFLCGLAIVLSIIALARSGGQAHIHKLIGQLRKDLDAARKRLDAMDRQPGLEERPFSETPVAPAPAAYPASDPSLPPSPSPAPGVAIPPLRPAAPLSSTLPPRPVLNLEAQGSAPETAPPPSVVVNPIPMAPSPRPAAAAPILAPRPAPPRAVAPRPRVELPAAPPKPPRNIEELLTKLFLRIGVATLVIGVVFFLAYKLQTMGPAGKVATGLFVGGSLLGTGLYAERREDYRTLGRALIAGAWGILYFVVYAAGFIPAAQILTKIPAVIALLAAAAAAVGFSLRYRSEWTTTSAFLLIFLSLGISAYEVGSAFSLGATLIVAMAMAVLLWRLGWARLLGLGVPATWGTFTLILLQRAQGAASLGELGLLALAWIGFQAALLVWEGTYRDEKAWLGTAQLTNFLGGLLLSLWIAQHSRPDVAWGVALAYGLAHLATAFLFRSRERRGLYLLTATEGLAALALVTPLRLGLHHHLTPLYRLLGLELLLAGGVFLRERYFRRLAYGAFAFTAVEIVVYRLDPATGIHRLLLTGAAAGVFLLNTALLRTVWGAACEAELPAVGHGFSWAGTTMLLLFLVLKVPQPLVGLWIAGIGALWIGAAFAWGQEDLTLQGFVLNLVGLIALLAITEEVHATPRAWIPGLGCALLAVGYGLARGLRCAEFSEKWVRTFAALLSVLMLISLAAVLMIQLAVPWQTPALAGSALVFLVAGLWLGFGELSVEAGILTALMGLGLLANAEHLAPHRLRSLGLSTAFTLGAEGVLRLAWPRTAWSERGQRLFATGYGILGHLLLVVLIFLEVPKVWIAPTLMFIGAGYLGWFRLRSTAFKFCLGLIYTLLGFIAVAAVCWPLQGLVLGLPERMVSILLAVALAFAAQDQLQRRELDENGATGLMGPTGLAVPLGAGLLLLICATLGYFIKVEALAHEKNLLVALAWGLLGVLFLERGRALKSWTWLAHGHLWMLSAFLHFIFVNLLQEGTLGGLSLRLLTALPFFGLLAYVYLSWAPHHAEAAPEAMVKARPAYLYGMQLALALLVLYELPRAYVVVAWSLQALLSLLWGLRREAADWLRCASILGVAVGVRGIGTNLAFRDALAGGFSTNAVAIPFSCALLLAGYVLLRRRHLGDEGSEGAEDDGLMSGRQRLPWFWAQAVLLFAAIWVELSGTHLTIFLSIAGLGMIGLGFLVAERIARLLGLSALSFCILKLFVYDLRGLSGAPRWLSFMALGAILILVTFLYTRFKARLERLL